MRKQSLVLLFIIGLLIGSNAPAFADYGYKRVTSGSFILRGMFTNGGKLLSSGSFNLYGALSLEQGASKLSGASYNLDFEFPSIIRIPRAESTSAIDSLVATLKQDINTFYNRQLGSNVGTSIDINTFSNNNIARNY